MKNLVIFLLAICFAFGAQAQTYEKNVARINSNINQWEKELADIKSSIYYLEVVLDREIGEDSTFLKGRPSRHLDELRAKRMFRYEELKNLYEKKDFLQKNIDEFNVTLINGEKKFSKEDMNSRLPVRMTSLEYKQRNRALMYKLSENWLSNSNQDGLFAGLLVNYKIGRNELARFTIKNADCPELPSVVKTLNPQERLTVHLPIGNYFAIVESAGFYRVHRFSVNPLEIKHLDGQDVYWGVYKELSNQ